MDHGPPHTTSSNFQFVDRKNKTVWSEEGVTNRHTLQILSTSVSGLETLNSISTHLVYVDMWVLTGLLDRSTWGLSHLHRGSVGPKGAAPRGLLQVWLSHSVPSRSGRADLAAIYHERIDVEGHHYGPSSPQRKDALKAVDTVLKYMIQWIQVTQSKGN